MELQPEQFGHLMGTDPGVRGKSLEALADTYYNREPEYMSKLEDHIKENGMQTPVGIRMNYRKNRFGIERGHHRAAAAHRLGMAMPVTDLDEVSPEEAWKTDAIHESWSGVARNKDEDVARSRMGQPGEKGYKTRMK